LRAAKLINARSALIRYQGSRQPSERAVAGQLLDQVQAQLGFPAGTASQASMSTETQQVWQARDMLAKGNISAAICHINQALNTYRQDTNSVSCS
jgi:hypothetical protein